MSELKHYSELIGKHKGENAFVIGAGTSLLKWMGHEKRDAIHDHVVMSVNASIIEMPWDDGDSEKRYWISNDALCRRWSYWPYVKSSKSIGIVRDSWRRHFDEIPDFYQFNPRSTSEGVIDPHEVGLAYCSSVPSALDLCIQMGCKNVFLLGVDQYMSGDKSHFWQFLPKEDQPTRWDNAMATHGQQKKVFVNYNDIAYPALKGFADKKEANVYTVNPKSNVKPFEKIDYDRALEIIGV